MTSMSPEQSLCLICDLPRSEHTPDKMNHQFSTDGQLVPVDKRPKSPNGTPAKGNVVLGRLIGMLANKGILDPDEVARLMSED